MFGPSQGLFKQLRFCGHVSDLVGFGPLGCECSTVQKNIQGMTKGEQDEDGQPDVHLQTHEWRDYFHFFLK